MDKGSSERVLETQKSVSFFVVDFSEGEVESTLVAGYWSWTVNQSQIYTFLFFYKGG
jgi:hypothetical protein